MDKLYYRLKYRNNSQTVNEEIICRKHYEQASQPGHEIAPLEGKEASRLEQTVTPYTGDLPCATCEADAEFQREQKGAA